MMSDKYTSIAAPSQGLFKDKGSRFIGYAFPISGAGEVKPLLESLEKEHHAARHHCYAYRLFSGEWRSSDDGEPSGSAGRQILGQIDSAGLQDVLVVVVRYFGGILLGVPGLIRAYRAAAADALANAVPEERTATRRIRLRFSYDQMPAVERMLKNYNLSVVKRDFSEDCSMEIDIPLSLEEKVEEISNNLIIFKDNSNQY